MANPLGALGSLLQLLAVTEEGKARVEDAEGNALLAEQAAADARIRGGMAAGRARLKRGQLLARQKVAYAASGVDPTVGTPAAVQASTDALGELDALTIEANAAREAWGLGRQGQQLKKQADRERRRTQYQQLGAILGGFGDVVG
ncbi:MAG: hypothetical protein ACRD4T_00175 [Candidatus Acidiferrales bacterium]